MQNIQSGQISRKDAVYSSLSYKMELHCKNSNSKYICCLISSQKYLDDTILVILNPVFVPKVLKSVQQIASASSHDVTLSLGATLMVKVQ